MLLGQEAFLAPDLRRETKAGGWGGGGNELALVRQQLEPRSPSV